MGGTCHRGSRDPYFSKIKKRQKQGQIELPEPKLRQYEPEGGKSDMAHLSRPFSPKWIFPNFGNFQNFEIFGFFYFFQNFGKTLKFWKIPIFWKIPKFGKIPESAKIGGPKSAIIKAFGGWSGRAGSGRVGPGQVGSGRAGPGRVANFRRHNYRAASRQSS